MVQKAQLQGAGDGTAVPAGYVGEVLSQSRLKSAATALTTGTVSNVTATALTLTPGVWSLSGAVGYRSAATTSVSSFIYGISLTSATLPASDTSAVPNSSGESQGSNEFAANVPGSADNVYSLPSRVVVVSANTPFHLVARSTFTTSTMSVYGYISATRIA